jgi:hypothetical protein
MSALVAFLQGMAGDMHRILDRLSPTKFAGQT